MKLEQLKPAVKRLLENHLKVKMKLTKKSMTMKDLKKTSGIERGQLNYWEFQNVLPKQKTTRGKSWRRFSRLDLMGFAIVEELSKHGIELTDLCKNPVDWLAYAIDKFHLLRQFSKGNRIYIYMDEKNINYFYGDDINIWKEKILPMQGPVTIIRIDPIMRDILRKTQRKDFYVKFTKDRFGGKLKVIYYVEGEEIVLGR
ncbi:MerR family transcriptional regulator [candidate division WOR-3 bacterium]|nr:MerR family transcriptional regulator [candidate division WOR-3 bacterium]